ncbi:MAG: carbohydrate-binding family 9-like protein [Acidobacteriota bacterium]|nr:carbohydrate-binding family 9-like protein [Acidobacteriota bacterium]
MPLPAVTVARSEFSIEEPWSIPPGCQPFQLLRSTDGKEPGLTTTVAVYADPECFNVVYQAHDDAIVATYFGHDEPLWKEDVVEVFLAPADIRRYYEIEVNPLGTTFDARIDSPDGVRATMTDDLSWTCENLFAAIRKTPGMVETIVRIPFASLDVPRPAPGDEWRGNFFRVDRDRSRGDEFTAWSPTMKNPADFHVAAAFGRIVFA